MSAARRAAVAVAVLAGGLALAAGPAVPAPAAGPTATRQANQALVIVDTGTERREAYVSFTSATISGLEALQLAGMAPVYRTYGSNGLAVCALCGRGCPADGSCLTCEAPEYWAYFRDDAGGGDGFVYSGSGAGSVRVGHGDVEGWRWGTGEAPAWEPFAPPQPTTTTTTTATTSPPPPSTTPTTAARPPSTPAPTVAPAPGGPAGTGAGDGAGTGTTAGTGEASPTTAPGSTTTSAAGTTSSPSTSGPSTTAPTSPSAGGVPGRSTSEASASSPSPEEVDGDELAAVGGTPDTPAGGGSAASIVGFTVVLGLVAGAGVLARRGRRARASG